MKYLLGSHFTKNILCLLVLVIISISSEGAEYETQVKEKKIRLTEDNFKEYFFPIIVESFKQVFNQAVEEKDENMIKELSTSYIVNIIENGNTPLLRERSWARRGPTQTANHAILKQIHKNLDDNYSYEGVFTMPKSLEYFNFTDQPLIKLIIEFNVKSNLNQLKEEREAFLKRKQVEPYKKHLEEISQFVVKAREIVKPENLQNKLEEMKKKKSQSLY